MAYEMTERSEPYSGLSRLFHWGVALLIFGMIPAGVIMVQEGLPRSLQNTLFIFHKNVGVIVLGLMLARLAWRFLRPPPALPVTIPAWQRWAAGVSHTALYVLAIAVPVAGYVRVRAGGFPIEWLDAMGAPTLVPKSEALAEAAKAAHYYGGLLLAAVIAVHIGAALYHGLIRKDGIVSRIWPPVGRSAAHKTQAHKTQAHKTQS